MNVPEEQAMIKGNWLVGFCFGDEFLPSYIRIITHYKDP